MNSKIRLKKNRAPKPDSVLMRGAQPDANYSTPGFLPEARFRLPHRPQENGKEINIECEIVLELSLNRFAHRASLRCRKKRRGLFSFGAMRKTIKYEQSRSESPACWFVSYRSEKCLFLEANRHGKAAIQNGEVASA